jgi:putative ABC transport system ATP-binding protein/lipoprotein-releasing system ATP-binding protein
MTVARALAADRPVVLADEPTGQLDAKSSGTVADALRALAAAGRCVIVATHDPAVSQRCDAVFPVASTRAGS